MQRGLINSAWAQAGRATTWGIHKTAELGFDSIDIFTDPLDIDIQERRRIKTECDKAGLPIISICRPRNSGVSPASPNLAWSRR